MNISILIVLSTIILLSSKSNQTIIIDKDSHWRNYTGNENINSEVILMAKKQSWAFNVFLNNILILWSIYLPCK